MVWATNVYHYFEETETYYITDGVGQEEEYDDDDQDLDPQEAIQILDEGWAMFGGIKNMPPLKYTETTSHRTILRERTLYITTTITLTSQASRAANFESCSL